MRRLEQLLKKMQKIQQAILLWNESNYTEKQEYVTKVYVGLSKYFIKSCTCFKLNKEQPTKIK